jgi:hypothetical protein
MAGLNCDVAELVLKELKGLKSATTTWGTVSKETALALHNNVELWSPAFNFCALPVKLQRRLVCQTMSACFDWQYRMLHCVSTKFCDISFQDGCDEDWHWLFWAKEYLNKDDTPYSPASWSWSGASERSFLWKELSRSENGDESSSGSDDVDLLAEFKARGGV